MMIVYNTRNIKMFSRLSSHTCNRGTLRINNIIPKTVPVRSIHLVCRVRNDFSRNNFVLDAYRRPKVFSTSFLRYASTNDTGTGSAPDLLDQIPEPPPLPTLTEDITSTILKYHPNGEPTFESIGLGGYWPSGLVQSALEYLHIHLDIPWWTTIMLSTLCIRLLMFPLIVRQQRILAEQSSLLPEFQKLQNEVKEATMTADIYEQARVRQKYMKFVYEKGFSPLKNLPLSITQVVVMGSNFFGLREMANLPVESFKQGGLWWFTDLTVYDPYYLLPTITCTTLLITLELGAEFTSPHMLGKMKYLLRAAPIGVFLFTLHFPSALLWYWSVSNFLSLAQVGFLRIPVIREYFKLPKMQLHLASAGSNNQQGFVQEFKTTVDNYKISRNMADRARLDRIQFNNAARGPPPLTFKYDPTKEIKSSKVLTKER